MKNYVTRSAALLLLISILTGISACSFLQEPEISAAPASLEEAVGSEIMLSAGAARDELFTLPWIEQAGTNPITCTNRTNQTLMPLIYEGLFQVTPGFAAEPVLCDSYEISEDGLTYTVKLKSGVKFHNGKPLDASDVVYSFGQASGNPESRYLGRFSVIEGVTAQDSGTVLISLNTPHASLPLILDIPIIPLDSGTMTHPPGTGPYSLVSTQEDSYLQYNPDWWSGTSPSMSRIYLIATTGVDALRGSFETSQLDLIYVDPTSSSPLKFHNDYELWLVNTTVMHYVGFNYNSKVFYKTAARAAVTFAIDREAIVSDIFGNHALASALPANSASPLYFNMLNAEYSYNPNRITATMEAAGFVDYNNNGVMDFDNDVYMEACKVSFIVNSENEFKVQAAQAITDVLNENGFDVTLRQLSYEDYVTALSTGNYDMYYGEVTLTPDFDLTSLIGSGSNPNYSRINNSELDALLADFLADPDNAYRLYAYLLEKGVIAPVLFKIQDVMTSRGSISNLTPTQWNVFYGIENWSG